MKSIFYYTDYRAFLADYYLAKKKAQGSFSYRIFSRRAGFKSPVFIKLVIDGKANLSQQSALQLGKAMNLDDQELDYFSALVEFNQARKDDVKKETREKILAIARDMDYVPNLLARGLLHNRTRTIGVVVTDNSNPFYARLLRGIEDCARQEGYNIILCNSDEDPERESDALHILKAKRVDGILITPASTCGGFPASLAQYHVPFVLVNRSAEDAKVDYVKTDNVLGAKMAMQRLVELDVVQV